jgi:pimeloyl-ACP methyl ester carboxylesterase
MVPLLAYLGIAGLVAVYQRRLIYHPPRLTAEELRPYQERQGLLPWTNAAGLRIGWRRPCGRAATAGTWLLLHGNAGSAGGLDYIIDPLQEGVPADVHVLEYPGYADRPGRPTQAALLDAASEAFETLAAAGPVTLVGESLGTGPACYLAGRYAGRVRGVLLLVPFRELAEAAASHYPWLPVRLLLRDRFPSHEWLRGYAGPLAAAVAGSDEVVPAESGRRLVADFAGRKRMWDFPGENHWQGSHRPPAFYAEAWAWLNER